MCHSNKLCGVACRRVALPSLAKPSTQPPTQNTDWLTDWPTNRLSLRVFLCFLTTLPLSSYTEDGGRNAWMLYAIRMGWLVSFCDFDTTFAALPFSCPHICKHHCGGWCMGVTVLYECCVVLMLFWVFMSGVVNIKWVAVLVVLVFVRIECNGVLCKAVLVC